jgi:hypothetical protein
MMEIDLKEVENWYMRELFLCMHFKNGIYIEIPPNNPQIYIITNMLTDGIFKD